MMAKYTVEQWKEITKDFLLEQNAKVNAAHGAQIDSETLARIKKENLIFVNRMLPDYIPTLK